MSNPVFKVLNKPLTILDVERKLFFAVTILSMTLWTGFDTLVGSAICWFTLIWAARKITSTDPQLPRIIINYDKYRLVYDPMRYKPHPLIIKKRSS